MWEEGNKEERKGGKKKGYLEHSVSVARLKFWDHDTHSTLMGPGSHLQSYNRFQCAFSKAHPLLRRRFYGLGEENCWEIARHPVSLIRKERGSEQILEHQERKEWQP